MNRISITDTRNGDETICCYTAASDILGMERMDLYRLIRKSPPQFNYRHFLVNTRVLVISHGNKRSLSSV